MTVSDSLNGALAGLPSWAPAVGTGLALVACLAVVLGLRRSGWLSGIGAQSVVALGGVAVSVHGLWGFATTTAGLTQALAVAFIGVFDAAEMVLLVMLYRAADPKVGWTRELRLMHRTAWTLVGFSAAMNAIHAPNWWSRPVLAAIPALATWLIELQLRAKLGATKRHGDEDEAVGRPGPARLVVLVWQHAWARLFAALGLDARVSGGRIARAAMAQKAAGRVYQLRLALAQPAERSRARRRLERRRRRAQKALDRADVATDPGQALALVRRLAALTRADEVARLDYADPQGVLDLIEGLAVTPAVEGAEASSRAREAEAARQRAEAAREEAETARQRAEEAVDAARKELEELEERRTELDREYERTAGESEGARQRAEDARREIETARQRAADILTTAQQEADAAREAAQGRLTELEKAVQDRQQALDVLADRVSRYESECDQRQQALQQLTEHISQAQTLRDRLRGDLASLASDAPAGAAAGEEPLFRSEAKQAGWQHYTAVLDASGGRDEPTAAELAERFGVDGGNARNWLRDFRAARAAQLAARPPRAAAQPRQGVAA
ncbi:hypothetical protein [Streptomyces smyrnaeus]|uniref:hypothetical protein n=1 Tax=Streptomyces smyrnaeus TaxID=1387713 RepID=UPI0033D9EA09